MAYLSAYTEPFRRILRRNDTPGGAARPSRPASAPLPDLPHNPAERVRRAFDDIPLNDRERTAIAALLDAPGATAPELGRACGWMATGWRTQMILLCQRRRRYLWPGGMGSDITNGAIVAALTEYRSDTLAFSPRADLVHILQQAVQDAG